MTAPGIRQKRIGGTDLMEPCPSATGEAEGQGSS